MKKYTAETQIHQELAGPFQTDLKHKLCSELANAIFDDLPLVTTPSSIPLQMECTVTAFVMPEREYNRLKVLLNEMNRNADPDMRIRLQAVKELLTTK